MPAVREIGDGGPRSEHSGRALLRHIVSKSPKPMGTAIRYMAGKESESRCRGGLRVAGRKPMRYTVNVNVKMVKRVLWLKIDETRYYGIPT